MRSPVVACLAAGALLAVAAAPSPVTCPPVSPEAFTRSEVVDLTHTLDANTPYWPGLGYFAFKVGPLATLEKDKVFSQSYATPEHLGTHVDAPNHFHAGGIPLDAIPVASLFGPAVVLDLPVDPDRSPDALFTRADLAAWEKAHGAVPEGAIAILRTGWSRRAGDTNAYRNADAAGTLHFPSFALDAVQALVGGRKAAAIGIDTLSVDPGVSKDFPVHHYLGEQGRYAIENLAGLERLPATGAFLIVAPLKIGGGSGGQARVFAVLP